MLLNRNKNATLYLPNTFQASDIELPAQKFKLNIYLTKSPNRDHIYKFIHITESLKHNDIETFCL